MELEQNNIEVERISEDKCDAGTTISIDLSDKMVSEFIRSCKIYKGLEYREFHEDKIVDWFEWFAFEEPKVNYIIDGETIYTIDYTVPNQEKTCAKKWYSFSSSKFDSFKWTYKDNDKLFSKGEVFSNGILIPYSPRIIGLEYGMSIDSPYLSIVDKQNKLDINLSRSTLLQFPDEKNFIIEAYKYFLAKLLTFNGKNSPRESENSYDSFELLWLKSRFMYRIIECEKGFTLMSVPFLLHLNIKNYLNVFVKSGGMVNTFPFEYATPKRLLSLSNHSDDMSDFHLSFFKNFYEYDYETEEMPPEFAYEAKLINLWTDKKSFENSKEEMNAQAADTSVRYCSYISSFKKFLKAFNFKNFDDRRYCHFSCGKSYLENKIIFDDSDAIHTIAEYQIKAENIVENNVMLKLIGKYLGQDAWIPLSIEERVKKFPLAFKELRHYM